jgi:hypothetical protein
MEIAYQRPLQHPLFRKSLCRKYQPDDEFKQISSTQAKKKYDLAERDLLPLPVSGVPNFMFLGTAPIRYYAVTDVKKARMRKLEEQGMTLEESEVKREEKSRKGKEGYEKARAKREDEYRRGMQERGLPLQLTNRMYGIGDKYINLRWARGERRLKLEEVLNIKLYEYYLEEYSGYQQILDWKWANGGIIFPESWESIKLFTLSTMEIL